MCKIQNVPISCIAFVSPELKLHNGIIIVQVQAELKNKHTFTKNTSVWFIFNPQKRKVDTVILYIWYNKRNSYWISLNKGYLLELCQQKEVQTRMPVITRHITPVY
jgi:hypothetical protein